MKGTVAAIENCVEVPSSLGAEILGVTEEWGAEPTPPSLPQAPQVSQLLESSMLSITVAPFPVVGVGVGAGEEVEPAVWERGPAGPPPQDIRVKIARIKVAPKTSLAWGGKDRDRCKGTSGET